MLVTLFLAILPDFIALATLGVGVTPAALHAEPTACHHNRRLLHLRLSKIPSSEVIVCFAVEDDTARSVELINIYMNGSELASPTALLCQNWE